MESKFELRQKQREFHRFYGFGPGINPIPALPDENKTEAMKEIEEHLGQPINVLLKEKYIDRKKSFRDIGKELSTPETTIRRWIHRIGIPARSKREAELLILNDPIKKQANNIAAHSPAATLKKAQTREANREMRKRITS